MLAAQKKRQTHPKPNKITKHLTLNVSVPAAAHSRDFCIPFQRHLYREYHTEFLNLRYPSLVHTPSMAYPLDIRKNTAKNLDATSSTVELMANH